MALIHTALVMPYTSGFARDVSEITFNFDSDGAPDAADYTAVDAAVSSFINNSTGQTQTIANRISAIVSRAACYIRKTHTDVATGLMIDPPVLTPITLAAAAAGGSLPLEVALCSSYVAPAIVGVPAGRRRGRFYVGPLNVGVAGTAVDPAPQTVFLNDLATATERMFNLAVTGSVPMVVWSRANSALYEVTGGYVDNEWDTQRRRGNSPTARDGWGTEA